MYEAVRKHATESIWSHCRPDRALGDAWRRRDLIRQLARREISARYRATMFGMAWPLLIPLLMLCVYTFVFGVVFKARWNPAESAGLLDFSLTLYCGLLMFNLLSESTVAAVGIIVANPNYVKKVVFPLEVLPIVAMGPPLFNLAVGLAILVVGIVCFSGQASVAMLFFPLALLPLMLLTVGIAWLLAALGVFIRDLSQAIGFVMQVLIYASPVFYPLSLVGEPYGSLLRLNPMTHVIENGRRTLMWGQPPDWPSWIATMAIGLAMMTFGYMCFMRSRHAFADVI